MKQSRPSPAFPTTWAGSGVILDLSPDVRRLKVAYRNEVAHPVFVTKRDVKQIGNGLSKAEAEGGVES